MRSILLLTAILLVMTCALVYEAHYYSVTADEPSHLAVGYMYWRGQDVLQPSDSPPLTRMLSGWIPALLSAPLQLDARPLTEQNAYQVGRDMMSALKPESAQRLFFYTRLPFLLFPIGIVVLLWHWARLLFHPSVRWLLAIAAAVEPTLLGHGALINSDVPAAFASLFFGYTAWKFWNVPTVRNSAWLISAVVVGLLTKFTLLPLLFFAAGLILWKAKKRFAIAALLFAVSYLSVLAAYEFHAEKFKAARLYDMGGTGIHFIDKTVANCLSVLPWPPQFIRGIRYIRSHLSVGFNAYMLGHRISGPQPLYYFLALAVKFTIPLQFLTLSGLAVCVLRRRHADASAAIVIWGLAFFFLACGVLSNFHIGIRHILPAFPFLLLGSGFALDRLRWTGLVIAAWLVVSSGLTYPDGIAYFNEWIGGPDNGRKYLADSNIDWGQDFRALGDYVRRERITNIRLSLFGLDDATGYLPFGSWQVEPAPWDPQYVAGPILVPRPGLYAISVNNLLGFLFQSEYERYFSRFQSMRPVGRAGYSISIFRVPPP